MATARTADAVAICAAGGKKICDDRLPLRRLMQSSGKGLLPRLGVSATNSPIPQHGRTVDVRWQSPGPGRGQIRLSTPATLGGGSAHCNNQSLIWHTRTLLTMLSARIFSSDREGGQSKPNAAERFEHVFQTVTDLEGCTTVSYYREFCTAHAFAVPSPPFTTNPKLVMPRGASRRRVRLRARIWCDNTAQRRRPGAAVRATSPLPRWRRRATPRCGRSAALSTASACSSRFLCSSR